jgi:hypothetical protein
MSIGRSSPWRCRDFLIGRVVLPFPFFFMRSLHYFNARMLFSISSWTRTHILLRFMVEEQGNRQRTRHLCAQGAWWVVGF